MRWERAYEVAACVVAACVVAGAVTLAVAFIWRVLTEVTP